MAPTSPKDYVSTNNYPRALSSIIISVGLLAVFVTFASWILLSHPVGSVVRSYFYGVDQTSDLSVPVSWEGANGSQVLGEEKSDVSGTDLPKSDSVTDPGRIQNVGENLPKSEGSVDPDKSQNVSDTSLPKSEGVVEPDKSQNVDDTKLLKSEGVVEPDKSQNVDDTKLPKSEGEVEPVKSQNVDDTKLPKSEGEAEPDKSQDVGYTSLPKSEGVVEPDKSQNVGDTSLPKSGGVVDPDKRQNVGDTSLPKSEGEVELDKIQNVGDVSFPKDAIKVDQNQSSEVSQENNVLVSTGNDTMHKDQTTEKSETSPGSTEHKQSLDSECDLYHGEWFYDSAGPLYTNNSCPIITQMQNCQGNGRPDKEYENWRWRPTHCELPRFNATKFLELMSGKTLAFVGDSVARNQMESLLCLLWQVEVPKNRGNRHMQRWHFRSKSVMIARIWSSWLVHQTGEPFNGIPKGIAKLHLDLPDEVFMEYIPTFDVIILSSGHWFAKQSIYMLNNEIVGAQLWSLPKGQPVKINNIDAFGISVETSLTAMVTHPNYTGLTIVRAYSPDHYEGGAWNTGGSCTGKVRPILPGQLLKNDYTETMHEKQVSGFYRAIKKQTNRSKLKLMDITEPFSYRHDGHPGPYRSPDPNKITKRGPDGKPPPQDCLHWCMPGPVDTWNELVLETIRREFESDKNKGV